MLFWERVWVSKIQGVDVSLNLLICLLAWLKKEYSLILKGRAYSRLVDILLALLKDYILLIYSCDSKTILSSEDSLSNIFSITRVREPRYYERQVVGKIKVVGCPCPRPMPLSLCNIWFQQSTTSGGVRISRKLAEEFRNY